MRAHDYKFDFITIFDEFGFDDVDEPALPPTEQAELALAEHVPVADYVKFEFTNLSDTLVTEPIPETSTANGDDTLTSRLNNTPQQAESGIMTAIANSDHDFAVEEHHRPGHDQGGRGGSPDITPDSTPIDLFTVVLHEIGHALNLGHSDPFDGVQAVMDPYYPGPVSGLFAQDIANIQALLPEDGSVNNTGWQDLDGDGIVVVTYSFVPDKTKMETGISNLFKSFNKKFGSEDAWQDIFRDAFDAWELASQLDNADDGDLTNNIELKFVEVADAGLAFNFFGSPQNDSRVGDIRIGTHKFDGSEGVLAHTYFPPPNGITAAGDMHLDPDENWQDLQSTLLNSQTNLDNVELTGLGNSSVGEWWAV